MKNIFSKTNKKGLFIILLAPVSFLSTLFLSDIIQNIIKEPNSIFYLDRISFFILLILMSLFSILVFETFKNTCENKKKSYILSAISIILIGLYIISFIHPTGQGVFFLEIFMPSLIINIILTYFITLIIKGLMKK